jgi:hypothetical protein
MGWQTDPHDLPDTYIPWLGTGAQTASTPEEAAALYAQLPKGSAAEQQQLEAESRQRNPELWGAPTSRWGDDIEEYESADLDEEDERGPYGDKMPRPEDLPNYGPLGWIIGAFRRARGG